MQAQSEFEPTLRYEIKVVGTPSVRPPSVSRKPRTPRATPKPFASAVSHTPTSGATPRTSSRPSVSSSRGSAGPTTNYRPHVIAAVVEFRNRQEVGIAAMNIKSPALQLYQFNDNQTYTNTIMILSNLDPMEILLCDTAENSLMHSCIKAEFDMVAIELIRRKYFNEEHGLSFIQRHALASSSLTLDASKYLCLASTACLMKYVEFSQSIIFAPSTLKVIFCNLDGHMRIDAATIKNLEIIAPLKASKKGKGSLFSTLNCCKTPMGARHLRQSLLQPLTDIPTLEMRFDAVQELLTKEEVFWELTSALPQFTDLDHLHAQLVQIPKHESQMSAERTVFNLLLLKKMLGLLPQVSATLHRCDNNLLKLIGQTLQSDVLKVLRDAIDGVLEAESSVAKKTEHAKIRTQLVFAVKMGLNGLLDVARATYCEAIEEIYREADKLKSDLNIASLKVEFTANRGFHLSLDKESFQIPGVSDALLQPVAKGKRVYCSTEDLISLDDRQKEAFAETLLMTVRVIGELLETIRAQVSWLYTVAESIALLDMLLAFANFVTLSENYVRPSIVKEGPIAIQSGRHAVAETLRSLSEFIPNDSFINPHQNFQIITGPNSSGKSTYLRQLGIMVIMAQIGCFVPAKFATFRVTDQLFSRMTMNDDVENNSGAFFTEMREAAYILKNVTDSSVVLIDELGRGTSNVDGVGIAWAICEALLQKKCYTWCATHFLELTDLSVLYSNVKNLNLKVESDGLKMLYSHQILEGPISEKTLNYGIYIAELAAFPTSVIAESRALVEELRKKRSVEPSSAASNKLYYELLAKITALKHASLPLDGCRSYLIDLRNKFLKSSSSGLS